MCFSSNVQCKLVSSSHAAKYRVIAHNLGSIAVLHNCTYLSSLRQLAVVVIFKETIIQVSVVYNLKLRWRVTVSVSVML